MCRRPVDAQGNNGSSADTARQPAPGAAAPIVTLEPAATANVPPTGAATNGQPIAVNAEPNVNRRRARAPMTRSRAAASVQQIVQQQVVDRRITRQMTRQMQQDQQRINRNRS